MPFEPNQETLDKLFARALESEEIRNAIDSSDASTDFFQRELTKRGDKIWSAAAEDISHLTSLEGALESAGAEFDAETPERPRLLRVLDTAAHFVPHFLVGAGVLLVGSGFFFGFKTVFGEFLVMPWSFAAANVLIILLLSWLLKALYQRSYDSSYQLYSEKSKNAATLQQLRGEHAKTLERIETTLLERGVKSELRAIINAELEPSYDTNLSVRAAPGLAEIFDPAYEIPTASKDKLVALLEDMPGGSIGIAGPRGAGKSTLIWSLCRGALSSLKGRPVYALMTSAPVKYDGREFILHLFSSLCYKLLGQSPVDRMAEDNPLEYDNSPSRWITSFASRRISLLLVMCGSTLLSLGLSVTIQIAAIARETPSSVTPSGQTPKVNEPAETKRDTYGRSWLGSWLSAAEIKPGSLLTYGFVLTALGSIAFVVRPSLLSNRRRVRSNYDESVGGDARVRLGRVVAQQAARMLREIRFQQSFSSGWSGSLKLPIGLEGSVNSALSLAERQRSLPEIVEAYRSFVKLATDKSTIVIGVDELDKLESDEAAQQFLNEIKAIFGLDHCYYLISVSENAITSFERRGLPFRDAFDSAFDTIIYVDYLALSNAKRLLRRRVIGLEVPFMCLCYCLSGGLARDLIRNCREMLEFVRAPESQTDLSAVCTQIVMTDVRAKLRAMEVSVRKVRLEPEMSNLIDRIRQISASTTAIKDFLAVRSAMPPPQFRDGTDELNADELSKSRRQIDEISLELHTYLYFAATLLEFFSSSLSEQRLRAAEESEEIAKLAAARQAFSVNAYTALVLLDQFRNANGLSVA